MSVSSLFVFSLLSMMSLVLCGPPSIPSLQWDNIYFVGIPVTSPQHCLPPTQTITFTMEMHLPSGPIDTSFNGPIYLRMWNDNDSLIAVVQCVNGIATYSMNFASFGPGDWTLEASGMEDPKQCHEAYADITVCSGGAFGDPQFIGLQGQQFQVHGRPDTLFNLISYPSHGLAVNSEFVYLPHGSCDYDNTQCWTHPGTYFGKMGIVLNNETHLLVNSGAHTKGLSVAINDKPVRVNDSIELPNHTQVRFVAFDVLEVSTLDFSIRFINSDNFMNLEAHLHDEKLLQGGKQPHHLMPYSDLHGLLGQTWRNIEYEDVHSGHVHPYQHSVDDYIVDTPFCFMHQHGHQ